MAVVDQQHAGEVVKDFRSRAELSRADIAVALRVTEGAVAHWERGRAHPRRDVAVRLDELLGADGAVIDAFGYSRPTNVASSLTEAMDQLRDQAAIVERLATEVEQLSIRFEDLAALVQQVLTDRGVPRSGR